MRAHQGSNTAGWGARPGTVAVLACAAAVVAVLCGPYGPAVRAVVVGSFTGALGGVAGAVVRCAVAAAAAWVTWWTLAPRPPDRR